MSRHNSSTSRSRQSEDHSSEKHSINFDRLFYRDLQRQFLVDLLKSEGDFLTRRGSEGGIVLSVHHSGEIIHFKFQEHQKEYKLEGRSFRSLKDLINYYYTKGKPLTDRSGAKLIKPIEVDFDMIKRDRIKLEKKLGAGNFGEVWKAKLAPSGRRTDPETVAVKILSGESAQKERDECLAEARIMSMLDHENVVGIRGVCFAPAESDREPQLLLILEYCDAGSLDKLLEDNMLADDAKPHALLDAARGIAYLHERDIIHRDIACRNCLASKLPSRYIVKIADFGLSRMAPRNYELATKRRLPVYSMPPEALQTHEWNKLSDAWSFGVLIFELYNKGKNPYEGYFNAKKMDLKSVQQTLQDGFRIDPPASMPDELVDIMNKCMSSASLRPTMDDVLAMLKKTKSYQMRRPGYH